MPGAPPWTADDEARLVHLWNSGADARDIAATLRRSLAAVRQRLVRLRKAGCPAALRPFGGIRKPVDVAEARKLLQAGHTFPAVAAIYGVHHMTIRRKVAAL